MFNIETFDNLHGGSVAYKALAHPLAAQRLERIAASISHVGKVAIYDPNGLAGTLLALSPPLPVEGIYVHDSLTVGQKRGEHVTRALSDLANARVSHVLIAAFDARRLTARIEPLLPRGTTLLTLDDAKIPTHLITNPTRYLDPVNFATNFATMHSVLVSRRPTTGLPTAREP
jgi:hypothetical protein